MNRLLLWAAMLAAGVFGAGNSFVSNISGLAGSVLAQESSGNAAGSGASEGAAGFGNGGAGFGSGGGAGSSPGLQSDGAGGASSSQGQGAAQDGAPDPNAAGEGTAGAKAEGEAGKAAGESEAEAEAAAAATEEEASTDPDAVAPAKAGLPNTSGTGNLVYGVDIDVPAFRGIEPSLTLSYNSSRKSKLSGLYQGWLGYAWGVKRHPKLTPDRRPILTPLGVERCGERPTGWSWPGLRSPVGRVG